MSTEATVPPTITTIAQAFKALGITAGSISKATEVKEAFTCKVKEAASDGGHYTGDMDSLTQAKEFLLSALAQAQEQARIDAARRKAREEETEENRQRKAREKAQHEARQQAEEKARKEAERQEAQEQAHTGEPPRLEGPAPQAEEREEPSQDQEKAAPNTTEIGAVFHLLQQRERELAQARQREQELAQELSRTQSRRAELERQVQTAGQLATQLRAILEKGTAPDGDL